LTRDDYEDAYYSWLLRRASIPVKSKSDAGNKYSLLLSYLYSKMFSWSHPMDENLSVNGLNLRNKFVSENPKYKDFATVVPMSLTHCTMLEIMVELAVACDNAITDPGDATQANKWFWIMIKSMGLDGLTNEHFDVMVADSIVEICIKREFEPNGEGSFFCVNGPVDDDFRNLSIWAQFLAYIRCNNY
jgi:hypothetical protein